MNKVIKIFSILLVTQIAACTGYHSPDRSTWHNYLRGASFTDMSETARIAKKPIYQGTGGKTVDQVVPVIAGTEYGDKSLNDSAKSIKYMSELESELYDELRMPGMSVQRAGTDVVVLLVRDAIMQIDTPDISDSGDQALGKISKILNKYSATFIEIAGYTDAMRDQKAAHALSLDMASRVGVYIAQKGINTSRMFIVGRGSARPIAAQDGYGRLTNRRIEIRICPVR
ncbi:MAG: OmpA family protein [Alphaproteobacteria bacterium]|nr:OmpA family protein [Alphaproteobacteria bacterium]